MYFWTITCRMFLFFLLSLGSLCCQVFFYARIKNFSNLD
nr:MAG TPA: hypothetical protein [Caudoviricetes sp.]